MAKFLKFGVHLLTLFAYLSGCRTRLRLTSYVDITHKDSYAGYSASELDDKSEHISLEFVGMTFNDSQ